MPLPRSQMKPGLAPLIAAALLFSSCEPAMQAKIEGGNPHSLYHLVWTGKFWMISITEYIDDKSLKPSKRDHEIWRVDANSPESAAYPSIIGKISYGTVPSGYHQSVPATGSPPSLIAGKYYSYFITSENGMPARGAFEIRNGNAVVARIQRPCSYFEGNGNEVEIPCDRTKTNH
jgi:hypothetical protein